MSSIETRKGQKILVDADDYETLSRVTWTIDAKGYAMRKHRDDAGKWKTQYMHRFVMGLSTGQVGMVDHINGDKTDNRKSNLRVCSNSENLRNRGAQRNNTSGFKGVTFHKAANKWTASITANGSNNYLGLFKTPEEAHSAYCEAARAMHGEFANGGKQ